MTKAEKKPKGGRRRGESPLLYDPGVIPTRVAPLAGETIVLKMDGLPPYKDRHFSIRNSRHKIHDRFIALRHKAIAAMKSRAPYRGAVEIDLTMHAPEYEKRRVLIDYMGGIMDTLDGSHGLEFTFLPIVYEDDCQVCEGRARLVVSEHLRYELKIVFA